MPELPEVETVRRGIESEVLGAVVNVVDIRRPDLRIPFPKGLEAALTGSRLLRLTRRAKYICFHMENDFVMILHLGMSGRVTLTKGLKGEYRPEKHDHLILYFENGTVMALNDARRFGMVMLAREGELQAHDVFAHMGPEPLENEFNGTVLYDRLRDKKTPLKAALLDQRVVAGLGNIYVC